LFIILILTKKKEEASEWRIVFYITAAVFLIGAIGYQIFADTKKPKWALESEETTSLLKP
jgi:membrane protein YdbS with pleckstrin-like domain